MGVEVGRDGGCTHTHGADIRAFSNRKKPRYSWQYTLRQLRSETAVSMAFWACLELQVRIKVRLKQIELHFIFL